MSPKTHTAVRTVASILFTCLFAVLPWLTAAKALTVLASLTAILGGAIALSNLFHVPAKAAETMQTAVDVLNDVRAAVPAQTMAAMKRIAGASLLLLALGGLGAVTASTEACSPATTAEIQTAAGPVAQGTLDGITCVSEVALAVTGTVDVAGIVQQCSKFGVDVALVYATVKSLLAQHQAAVMADAGLPDVAAALAPDPLTVHLVAILASGSSGK